MLMGEGGKSGWCAAERSCCLALAEVGAEEALGTGEEGLAGTSAAAAVVAWERCTAAEEVKAGANGTAADAAAVEAAVAAGSIAAPAALAAAGSSSDDTLARAAASVGTAAAGDGAVEEVEVQGMCSSVFAWECFPGTAAAAAANGIHAAARAAGDADQRQDQSGTTETHEAGLAGTAEADPTVAAAA
eukprot:TRINITY_DN15732_c0_g2_i1.p2 TRINITY_DN15732_c0_g2~~TRINITY_DN15732_c0_g2_i1.p2  ORF type:complete len:188 (-),score=49.06 TRINITY_DN15732_c0_g2_i1:381-944(-)